VDPTAFIELTMEVSKQVSFTATQLVNAIQELTLWLEKKKNQNNMCTYIN